MSSRRRAHAFTVTEDEASLNAFNPLRTKSSQGGVNNTWYACVKLGQGSLNVGTQRHLFAIYLYQTLTIITIDIVYRETSFSSTTQVLLLFTYLITFTMRNIQWLYMYPGWSRVVNIVYCEGKSRVLCNTAISFIFILLLWNINKKNYISARKDEDRSVL